MATVAAPPPPVLSAERDPADWTDEELFAVAVRRGALQRLVNEVRRNTQLLAGGGILLFFLLIAGVEIALHGAAVNAFPFNGAWALNTVHPIGPSPGHPFGVLAGLGIDLYNAVWQSTPWDLLIFAIILFLAVGAGTLLGAWAGFAGGWADSLLTGFADIMLAVPPFFLIIILYYGVAPLLPLSDAFPTFLLLFALVLFPYYGRPIRARAERVSREPYVEAARAAGATRGRLLARHVLPNSLYPAFAQIPIDVFNIFFVLTVFPFLGCLNRTGSSPNYAYISPLPNYRFPEWGNLLANGACYGWNVLPSVNWWWMYTFPAAVIVLFGLAITLACDGIERLLNRRV
jgi:peptide/nickel transport system permease protein